MHRVFYALALMAGLLAGPLAFADTVRIGFVTTLTTPAAVIGEDQRDAVDLAVKHLGGRMGDLEIELHYADDNFRPEIGKQQTDRLLKRHRVDFVAGYIWSHVLLASYQSVLDAGKFLISANAGPAQIAGELCHENFFSTSWQNDQMAMALGELLNRQGVGRLYAMVPNYAAGKNMLAGVERTFDGEIVGQDLTKWGKDAQLDFSTELAKVRASGADALFAFYPGGAGAAFIKQYQQSGLSGRVPLRTVFMLDALSLPKLQEAGIDEVLGARSTMFWSPALDVPANRRFVDGFRAEYGRYPSFYAAQAYDSIMLINSAVVATGGDLNDQNGLRAALERADFESVRGDFRYAHNHMPVQDFYQMEVVADADGNWTTRLGEVLLPDHRDPYADLCPQ